MIVKFLVRFFCGKQLLKYKKSSNEIKKAAYYLTKRNGPGFELDVSSADELKRLCKFEENALKELLAKKEKAAYNNEKKNQKFVVVLLIIFVLFHV